MLSSEAIAFICRVFSLRFCWYTLSCSATSGPGWRARIPLSSWYSLFFSWICRSFSTHSSVLAISRFCSVWIFWIISYVAGSEPSSLRHRCTFIGFSSSSLSAFTLVFSCSSSRCRWNTSRFRPSSCDTWCLAICKARRRSFTLSLRMRISASRSLYCASPFLSVDCWILSFSYSSASSSLRRMSCVPKMSRSLMTWSYSLRCASASVSILAIMWLSFSFSAACFSMVPSALMRSARMRLSCFLSLSMSFCRFWCASDSLTSALSLSEISSLSCSIWWFMILNLRRISAISSCASIRFLLYRLRSLRTASYSCCCCFKRASASSTFLFSSVICISFIFTSSTALRYLACASLALIPYRSQSVSSWLMMLRCLIASARNMRISFSSALWARSAMWTFSASDRVFSAWRSSVFCLMSSSLRSALRSCISRSSAFLADSSSRCRDTICASSASLAARSCPTRSSCRRFSFTSRSSARFCCCSSSSLRRRSSSSRRFSSTSLLTLSSTASRSAFTLTTSRSASSRALVTSFTRFSCRSTSSSSSFTRCSNPAMRSSRSVSVRCSVRCSFSLPSSLARSCLSSLSMRALSRCSRSLAVRASPSCSSYSRSFSSSCFFFAFCASSRPVVSSNWRSSFSVRPCSSSFCACSSSRSLSSSFTVLSCPMLRPAPCSTSRVKLLISSFSFSIVSFARISFS
mmetsp:Transcript_11850/g.37909  ORF Transcript_11850/g.37909 Transcript_11850/m.37909 type:complete len:691 (-) Transcript_11850:385-2457(-)